MHLFGFLGMYLFFPTIEIWLLSREEEKIAEAKSSAAITQALGCCYWWSLWDACFVLVAFLHFSWFFLNLMLELYNFGGYATRSVYMLAFAVCNVYSRLSNWKLTLKKIFWPKLAYPTLSTRYIARHRKPNFQKILFLSNWKTAGSLAKTLAIFPKICFLPNGYKKFLIFFRHNTSVYHIFQKF